MSRIKEISAEISVIMPRIARSIVLRFSQAFKMSSAQIFTIITLQEKGDCSFSELSAELHVAAPTVTGIIDRLEKGGYVKRIPSKTDRRVINVALTGKGAKFCKEVNSIIQKRWENILSKLSNTDCENYLKIMKKIQEQL